MEGESVYVFQCTPRVLPNTVGSPVMVRSGVFSRSSLGMVEI